MTALEFLGQDGEARMFYKALRDQISMLVRGMNVGLIVELPGLSSEEIEG